jgi:hypothetical protein
MRTITAADAFNGAVEINGRAGVDTQNSTLRVPATVKNRN